MDITQAAFGLDMKAASRIYFINPVLNPQVESQAIGRVRRISQQKPVSVETLVLRGSIEEVIVERKHNMTQAEHWKCKSILDDRPIYNWILNAKILPLPAGQEDGQLQMASLRVPQYIFGRDFGRTMHPDEGLTLDYTAVPTSKERPHTPPPLLNGIKRAFSKGPGAELTSATTTVGEEQLQSRAARRVRFAGSDQESE
jgi:hypothetical protein